MNYRTLGKTGEKVSVLGFGCMRLPVIDGNMKNINVPDAIQMIRHAVDQGVNYIDTAYTYHEGHGEEVVAKALRNGYRQKVFIATKLPVWNVNKYEDMEKLLDEQLDNLETHYLDFYLVHSLNREYWAKLEELGLLDFLRRAKEKKKVKHLGFSFHDEFDVFRKIVDSFPWTFCQIQYNYLDESFQAGRKGLEYAAEQGLGIVIMEPLRGGLLAKGLAEDAKKVIEESSMQMKPAELALRWIWDHSEVGVVLSGMTKMDEVIANIQYAGRSDQPLEPEEKNIINSIQKIYQAKRQINCTACKYCMPCPSGVDIPQCFEYYNRAYMLDNVKAARFWYNRISKASNCTQCGQCVTHCPQNIAIIEKLKEVQELFETQDEVQGPASSNNGT
jgi:predicted aldo/keto reductase-like oxidoreductase